MEQNLKWWSKLPEYTIPEKDVLFFNQWIAALRSNSFTQGKEWLMSYQDSEDGAIECYCAMGIAAKVLGEDNLYGFQNISSIDGIENTSFPKILLEEDDLNGLVNIVINLNDSPNNYYQLIYDLEDRQYDFIEISNYLEAKMRVCES